MVPGYDVLRLHGNGSLANTDAMFACGGLDRCLVAMGSYCGGDVSGLQNLSTSVYSHSKDLSLVTDPAALQGDYGSKAREQTIALPYCIKDGAYLDKSSRNLEELEQECLRALNKKLLVAWGLRKPYKAILLELILSGCGGALRDVFLVKLAKLCNYYKLKVIVDECLTGGRVGPCMTVTQTTPQAFQDCVTYITLGKFPSCGVLLCKTDIMRYAESRIVRGYSTNIDNAEAHYKLSVVYEHLLKGGCDKRRKFVLSKLNIQEKDAWGGGCLIFSHKAYRQGTMNLKCRLLPQLDQEYKRLDSIKLHNTEYTAAKVSELLFDSGKKWVAHMEQQNFQDNPLLPDVVEYLLRRVQKTCDAVLLTGLKSKGSESDENGREKETEFRVSKGSVMAALGGASKLSASTHFLRQKRLRDGLSVKCNRKPDKFVEDALRTLCEREHEQDSLDFMARKRSGKRRCTGYSVRVSKFPRFGLD